MDSAQPRPAVPVVDAEPLRPMVFNPQAQACMACAVRRHALFGVLDVASLERLHGRVADLRLPAGQALVKAGDTGQAAFTVREGVVRLERTNARGERRIVRLAGRGDLVGIEALLGQSHAGDAVACTPVAVCRLPRSLVDDLAGQNPQLLRHLMGRWQRALDDADEWITELLAGTARWRMLRLLLKLSEHADAEGRIWLPSRQEMGAMLDLTVETASRLVSALKREGVLVGDGGRQARLDMDALLAQLREAAAGRDG